MNVKRIIAAMLLLATVLAFASCSGGEEASGDDFSKEVPDPSTESSEADESSKEAEKIYAGDIADFSPYVTLGQYKGLEVEKTVLTDELVDAELKELMSSLKKYNDVGTTRPAQLGDVVIMDYKGYRADTNEAFEGGEDTDASLELGSNSFIPGFEEALVGHSAGESFDINVSFPEDYHEESLAGVEARFAITLKTVKEPYYPELTDEVAKSISFETADEVRAEARANAENAVYLDNMQKAWDKAVANAELKEYPEELYKYTVSEFVAYYLNYYTYLASMYGMELEDYVGRTEEEFRAEVEKEGKAYTDDYLAEEMIMYSIADAEFGRELSENEYNAKIDEYAKKEGITTAELKSKYDDETLRGNMLWDKVLLFVYENASFTESADVSSEISAE